MKQFNLENNKHDITFDFETNTGEIILKTENSTIKITTLEQFKHALFILAYDFNLKELFPDFIKHSFQLSEGDAERQMGPTNLVLTELGWYKDQWDEFYTDERIMYERMETKEKWALPVWEKMGSRIQRYFIDARGVLGIVYEGRCSEEIKKQIFDLTTYNDFIHFTNYKKERYEVELKSKNHIIDKLSAQIDELKIKLRESLKIKN